MQNPAERAPIPGVKRLLAIASGKGGVGKSTVTVNLALALAALGNRVGIVDADLHGPDVAYLLGARRLKRAAGLGMFAVAGSSSEFRDPPRPIERHGIQVLSLALFVGEDQHLLPQQSGVGGLLVRQMLYGTDWGALDYLLIDLPPGTGEPQATLARTVPLDGVILIVTPQDLALLDTTRSLALFQQTGTRILGVVENMSYFVCPHCGERVDVFERGTHEWSVRESGGQLLGEIPLDIAISRAANLGRPVVVTDPASPQAAAFGHIAAEVTRRLDARG